MAPASTTPAHALLAASIDHRQYRRGARSGPGGAAAFHEGAYALAAVVGEDGGAPGAVFDVQSRREVDVEAAADRVAGVGHGDRGVGGDLRGELDGRVAVGAGRDQAVDQAQPGRLGRGDVPAGEDQVGGQAVADAAGEQLGAASARDDADAYLGQADHGGLVGDDQVAAQGQL